MRARLALAAALALGACHRHAAGDVTLDADQDARNATDAKIDADLAAADAAARAPMARQAPAPAARAPVISDNDEEVTPTPDGPAEGNDQ